MEFIEILKQMYDFSDPKEWLLFGYHTLVAAGVLMFPIILSIIL